MKYVIHFNEEFSCFRESRKCNLMILHHIQLYYHEAFWPKYLGLGIPLNDILMSLGGKPIDIGWKYGCKSIDEICFLLNTKGTNPNVNVTIFLEEL